MITRKSIILAACLLLSLSLSAETIGVVLVQSDTASDSALICSRELESDIMDAFFFAGHIVSNDPIVISKDAYADNNLGIVAAKEGMVDYLVCVFTEFESGKNKKDTGDADVFKCISYRIVNVQTGKTVKTAILTQADFTDTDYVKVCATTAETVKNDFLAVVAKKGRN